MSRIILLNKPYDVLCQFSASDCAEKTLAHFIETKGVYPAGRLDKDSEGLVVLTDDGQLQHMIAHPKYKLHKTYYVQVEGEMTETAMTQLGTGIVLKDGKTKPAKVARIDTPNVWDRNPPIRQRENIPTSWVSITLKEGKNRQVRRMTAAVGYPTLRLIRISVGDWKLDQLLPGQSRELSVHLPETRPRKKAHNRSQRS